MRKILILAVALIGSATVTLAQDIITLKNGDEIKALVQEIGLSDVKYKKFENANGPTYTLSKSEIFMIKYENGEKDIFKDAPSVPATFSISGTSSVPALKKPQEELWYYPGNFWLSPYFKNANNKKLSKEEIRNILASVPEALKEYNAGRDMHTLGTVYSYIGGFSIGIGLGILINSEISNESVVYWVSGGTVFAVLGIVFYSIGNKNWKTAYNLYQNDKNRTTASLNFGLTRSGGIGFTLTF